ncbi:hypothetical protein [Streptomyces inusitatus]|uniref:hypothetical protein n=1 Tax=Streptomyces inusitatus TaxID=68221 RepID=UPI00167DAB85|nr:hypothetical protein [Streptomyces inusitatus]
MTDIIRVQPAPEQRQAFARWAVRQTPKIRTVDPTTFAVPAHLFAIAPEAILTGAQVDGHPYITPTLEDFEDFPELAEALKAVPGEPLPDVPASAYPPDSVPLDPPPDDGLDCCGRTFKSPRAVAAHRRHVHPEES